MQEKRAGVLQLRSYGLYHFSVKTNCERDKKLPIYIYMWLLGTRIIFEPRNGSFWNTEEKKTLRDCSLTPVSRIILEHTSFGSASKASENERFVRDFLQK